jgi:hypothetical protein
VIINTPWGNERRLYRGTYFSSTKAASRAMGFLSDRVGKLLRKNRGTRDEGYARFPYVWFMSAKAMLKHRIWNHEPLLRYLYMFKPAIGHFEQAVTMAFPSVVLQPYGLRA